LAKILEYFKISTLLVSHDLAEIYKLSHRILELKNGKIIKDFPRREFNSSKRFKKGSSLLANIKNYIENYAILFTKRAKRLTRRE
ncbi:hypothetical protein VWM66_10625, partial [Campylobacter jejuni]